MFRVGLAVIAIGFVVQMFSGYTYTVASPEACPATWEGEEVTSTEVLDASSAVVGYWCLVQGSFTQSNQPTYQNIPVGERSGYAQWYGFVVMLGGGLLLVGGIVRDRTRSPSPSMVDRSDGASSDEGVG